MSDGEGRNERWHRLIAAEHQAYDKARTNQDEPISARKEAFARDWCESSSRLLQEHVRSHLALDEGGPLAPYPWEAIERVAAVMESLAAGRLPQVVSDVNATGGRPERWPAERRDVAVAVFYVEMAKKGAIADRSFNKTVAEAFGVERTTVQVWVRNREKFCEGLTAPKPANIREKLREAGNRYCWNRTGEREDDMC
jgi:hypothetical protein